MASSPKPASATPSAPSSDFNATYFLVWQQLAKIATGMPVKVLAVRPGGIAGPSYVDVQPLVNQLDGAGSAVPHGTVYNQMVFRLQAGASAIVLDPAVGDIGWLAVSHRDISSVKATKKQANPGSRRKFSMADGLYFGGVLNGAATQYILLTDSGLQIVSPQAITLQAPTITLQADNPVVINPDANIGSKQYLPHKHPDPQGGDTGPVL